MWFDGVVGSHKRILFSTKYHSLNTYDVQKLSETKVLGITA